MSTSQLPPAAVPGSAHSWSERYAQRHQLSRISQFPEGILPPDRVRIYRRRDHFLLQWWDPAEKCTLNSRVEGDLVTAISQAREIDDRLTHHRSAGAKPRRITHAQLVGSFVAELRQRADAGEIDVATACRYVSALRHYRNFTEQTRLDPAQRYAAGVNRNFQLQFASYLNELCVQPNGRGDNTTSPMKSQAFVLDVVRSMFEWAADPERGSLLPQGFRNPFALRKRSTRQVAVDPIRPPDITVAMAVDFVAAADAFQLAVFTPMLLFGLRPGELGWLFSEHIQNDWLSVPNIAELDYTTKGRRDKRFPLVDCLRRLWLAKGPASSGLIYTNRAASEGRRIPPLAGLSLSVLTDEFRRRSHVFGSGGAAQRRRVRDQLMRDAGQLGYDHVEDEFQQLARRLEWPPAATLKDFRHLFSTGLQNSGMPEYYRRYLMGHAFGKAPIVAYTHLTEDKICEHFHRALATDLAPFVNAIDRRTVELGFKPVSGELNAAANPKVASP